MLQTDKKESAAPAVIVDGPQGCGKTRHAEALAM